METNLSLAEQLYAYIDSEEFVPVPSPLAVPIGMDGETQDFDEIFPKDPLLAAQVFRESNSSFFSGLPKANTLKEAFSRIGKSKMVLLSNTAQRSKQQKQRQTALYQERLLQHSIGCALGAQWLARKTGNGTLDEEAYLCGLIHDLGKFCLLEALEEQFSDLYWRDRITENLILEILSSLHVDVGGKIAEKWALPQICQHIILNHHEDGEDPLECLVKIANSACEKIGLGLTQTPGVVLAASPEAQALGLDEITLAELEILLEDSCGLELGSLQTTI